MKLHTKRDARDATIRSSFSSTGGPPSTVNHFSVLLSHDCNTLEDALSVSQITVKLLQDQVSQLKSEASTSVKQATHEHAVRYAEQMKAERDALLAETNTLAKDRYAEQCRADAAIARAEKLAGLLRSAGDRLVYCLMLNSHRDGCGCIDCRMERNINVALAERGEVGK